jgi:adenylosuccinate synthase
MTNTVVLDLFLGDSGKGKIVDYLAQNASSVIRFNGSNNAGHTLQVNGKIFKTHAVPSGVLYPHTINFIGHGCVIDPQVLLEEIEQFKDHNNNIHISGNAHIILPHHIQLDISREESVDLDGNKRGVGSTRRGVSPAYEAKHGRSGLRYKDLLLSSEEFQKKIKQLFQETLHRSEATTLYENFSKKLRSHIVEDSIEFVHSLASKGSIVFEGAQGTFLDVDIGEYPYVTSSNCTIGAVMTGTGLNMSQVNKIVGVVKAYGSYVGTNTSFPDIADESINNQLRELGQEYGATTGRPRRLCWLDLDQISTAVKINGPHCLAITRTDTLGQLPIVCVKYKNELISFEPWGDLKDLRDINDIPKSLWRFLNYIEDTLKVDVEYIGTGPGREDLIQCNSII